MNPLFVVLGLIDLFAGFLVVFPFSEAVLLYVMIYMIAKGIFFLVTGISSKTMTLHCLALCIIDILTGATLGSISLGYTFSFVTWIGYIAIGKGVYTSTTPLLS